MNQIPKASESHQTTTATTTITTTVSSEAIDLESLQGKFGWAKVMGIDMPYVFRRGERFASVRIFETHVLRKSHLNVHSAVFEYCFQGTMQAFTMTPAECRLFDEINSAHCDWNYGRKFDPCTDHIFRLADASLFSKFIMLCYSASKGVNSLDQMAGFVRIKDDVLPYATTSPGVRYVPTFCFEDASGFITSNKMAITGTHVPYLKLCCYILGIRPDLVRGKSINVVDLDSMRPYLPDEPFPDVWPVEDMIRKLEVVGPKSASMKWIVHSSLNPNKSHQGASQTTQSVTVSVQIKTKLLIELPEVDALSTESYRLQVFPKKLNGQTVHCINMVAFKFSRDVSGYLIYLWELHRKVFRGSSVQALVQVVNQHCNLYRANKAQIGLFFQKGLTKDRQQKGFDLLVVAKQLDESMEKLNQILQQ